MHRTDVCQTMELVFFLSAKSSKIHNDCYSQNSPAFFPLHCAGQSLQSTLLILWQNMSVLVRQSATIKDLFLNYWQIYWEFLASVGMKPLSEWSPPLLFYISYYYTKKFWCSTSMVCSRRLGVVCFFMHLLPQGFQFINATLEFWLTIDYPGAHMGDDGWREDGWSHTGLYKKISSLITHDLSRQVFEYQNNNV